MTEQERFDRCLAVVLRLEGGWVDDPRDAGGPTNRGVTQAELSEVEGHPVTRRELEALTPEEAARIYREHYWIPSRCADLPAGLDLMMLDTAVNMGPGAAARLLRAVRAADPERTLNAFASLRAERYRRLAGFSTYGRGWLRRLETVRAQALAWAAASEEGTAA